MAAGSRSHGRSPVATVMTSHSCSSCSTWCRRCAAACRPRRRPERLLADRGYDHDKYRPLVWRRGINPVIARRETVHGSGLGRDRWVVERSFSWLHNHRRLLVRTDRRHDIHEGFLALACCRLTWRRLETSLSCWRTCLPPDRMKSACREMALIDALARSVGGNAD